MRVYIPDNVSEKTAFERTTDLCICAHQDDAEIMAFCAINNCFNRPDKWYTGITVSDGAGSPRIGKFENFTDEQMKAVRVIEQERAADLGKYSAQVQLGFSSKEIKYDACTKLEEELSELLAAIKPQRVFIHNPADKHPTHVACCLRAINALRTLPKDIRPEKIYGMEVWRSLDWLNEEYKILFDCSAGKDLALKILSVFESQIAGGKNYDEAACGRMIANATFLESHNTDNFSLVSYGLDLTDAVYSNTDICEYILSLYNRTGEDIKSLIGSLRK